MDQTTRPTPLQRTLRWPVVRTALLVAVVVGSLLNLINQGDVILAGAAPHWPKLLLTYCVPFCVALFGAYSANRANS